MTDKEKERKKRMETIHYNITRMDDSMECMPSCLDEAMENLKQNKIIDVYLNLNVLATMLYEAEDAWKYISKYKESEII